MNNTKWFWFAIGYQTVLAYIVAFCIYQIGSVFTGNIHVVGLIIALLFVAGFIGSPQMNFIDATVVKEGGELFLEYGEHHRVILPPEKAAKLTDYIGKEVTFGIRPEDVFAADKYESAHEHNTVEASVRVFEMLGAEVFLYLTVDGFDVTCREHPSTKAKPGDIMNISFDVNKIHVFDKENRLFYDLERIWSDGKMINIEEL